MKSAILASVAVLLALQTSGAPVVLARADATFSIKTLSTRADLVSGGDVLVGIVTAGATHDTPRVTLRGKDLSRGFHRGDLLAAGDVPGALAGGGMFVGLVTGLSIGRNDLVVRVGDLPEKHVTLTNYPITGPIVSGPHQKPFVCQTDTFKLPDGSTLGPALDPDCRAKTVVQYVYLPRGGKEFKPLTDTTRRPDDVELTGVKRGAGYLNGVPVIVRVETGTMNRGIYQTLVLHDPTRDPAPTPFTPPPAWNRRFLALHGVGCPSGWWRQGGVMGVNPLAGANVERLKEGYAIFTNTLNHPTNSCNAFLAGETTMMGKEHAIEEFGVPEFTVSIGSSGGAYTSLQIADEFPGLFDGILINATFPDALSIALAGSDAHLLASYLATIEAGAFTPAQTVAVSGYQGMKAFIDAANQSQRTDPIAGRADIEGYKPAVWNEAMPDALKYDAGKNPRGARPTVFDAAINIYGADPKTGFALRPFDNVGVQYGLAALEAGAITPAQFLDLNGKIGGFDQDANPVASRSAGDRGAITRAYQAGLTLGGGGGLASIPVFDDGAYNDERGYHYQWFHFAIRERIAKQNGNANNHVMWRGPVQAERAWAVFIDWVASKKKPAAAVDGCWIVKEGRAPEFVAERQTFGSKPDSACNAAYPSYGNARLVAGGPVDANILKCQLKPISSKDYPASFTAADLQRLKTIFPGGVCEWSKPGVGQTRVVPWASFGPSPENLLISASTISLRSQP